VIYAFKIYFLKARSVNQPVVRILIVLCFWRLARIFLAVSEDFFWWAEVAFWRPAITTLDIFNWHTRKSLMENLRLMINLHHHGTNVPGIDVR
jgi:hypothetical protein